MGQKSFHTVSNHNSESVVSVSFLKLKISSDLCLHLKILGLELFEYLL